jgi:hypothetical protein
MRDAATLIVLGVSTFLYFLLYWGTIFLAAGSILLPENCFPSYWTLDRVGKREGEGEEGRGEGGWGEEELLETVEG